jgi:hypothetical protein
MDYSSTIRKITCNNTDESQKHSVAGGTPEKDYNCVIPFVRTSRNGKPDLQ